MIVLATFCTLVIVICGAGTLITAGSAQSISFAILCGSALIGRCVLAYAVHTKPIEAKTGAPCPYCGEPLRTPNAKQCFRCGEDWHDPVARHRQGEGLKVR